MRCPARASLVVRSARSMSRVASRNLCARRRLMKSSAHSGRARPPSSAQCRPVNPSAGHGGMVVVVDSVTGVVVVVEVGGGDVVLVVGRVVVVVAGVGTAPAQNGSAQRLPRPRT